MPIRFRRPEAHAATRPSRLLVFFVALAVSAAMAPAPASTQEADLPSYPMLTGQVGRNWVWEPIGALAPPPYTLAPVLVEYRLPAHTSDATRAGVEGHVIIEATIDDKGNVLEPRLIRSLAHEALNRGALEAVREWRFRPATRGGGPVAVTGIFTFSFKVTADDSDEAADSELRRSALQIGTSGLVAPVLLKTVLPEYTTEAQDEGIEGDVYLEAVVTVEGNVVEPKLIRGLPDDELNRRALEAVTKWKFEPGTKDDEPVPVIALFTVTFRVH